MLHDVRMAFRSLQRRPGFTAAAVLTMAVGVGPTAAILTLANWLFVRPIPGVEDDGRLGVVQFGTRSPRGSFRPASLSYANHADVIANSRVLAGLAGQQEISLSVAAEGTAARRVAAVFVMADYFRVLGVRLQVGRPFTVAEDTEPGGIAVAILSDRLSRTFYGGAATPIGRGLRVNGQDFTVIGVAPPGFYGAEPGGQVDIWLPGATYGFVRHAPRETWRRGREHGVFYEFVARLRPGNSFEEAARELQGATRALADAYPDENARFNEASAHVFPGLGVRVQSRASVGRLTGLMLGVAALLLVIACANVANLLIYRGVQRRAVMAVHKALGATGMMLARLCLIESLLLATAGGSAGILLAYWLVGFLEGVVLPGVIAVDLSLDWRVLGLTLAVSAGVGIVAGTAPAVIAARGDVMRTLRRQTESRRRHVPRLRSTLTVVQLSVSLALLVGALLLLVTLRNLRAVDVGFEPSGVTSIAINLRDHGYSDAQSHAFYTELIAGVRAVPGIQTVSVSQRAPLSGGSNVTRINRPGADPARAFEVYMNGISPGYFRTLGISLVRGRGFTEEDFIRPSDGTCGPVVISQSLARQLFGDGDAVGRFVTTPRTLARPSRDCIVVGVANDIRWRSLGEAPEPFLYQSLGRADFGMSTAVVLVRSSLPTLQVAAAVQQVASRIDSAVPLFEDRAFSEWVDRDLAEQRIFARVLGLLALVGFMLAAVGLHGLVAQTVAERTREFGIRTALGARRLSILGIVIGQAATLAGVGVAIGLVTAAGFSRVLESRLFGVQGFDLQVYAGAAAALASVVLIASLGPAAAATRVDPVDALRTE